jgi:ribonuclease Z
MKKRKLIVIGLALLLVGIVVGFYLAGSELGPVTSVPKAEAAGERKPTADRALLADPTGTVSNAFQYYPGTEKLAKDEVRVTACGTGMPAARRGQAATCFLFELGNGDKFLFDLGTGSMSNIMSLNIPADYLTKVFLSHLHTDHWGDLATLWAGGWTGGRTKPLKVWGPSGETEDMGTKYAIDGFLRTYNWDYRTRAAKISSIPGQISVQEFDHKAINKVIYNENGVVIRTLPAIHIAEGPVSFILEWNGYKIVFSGDSAPNKWFMKYAKDADFVIFECMLTPQQLMKFYGQPPERAYMMQTDIHTSAPAFGKIMSTIKPRHAVAFHFFNEEATRYAIYDGIRQTYDGPLSMATDMMVWNITRDEIKERMAVSADDAWDTASPTMPPPPDKTVPNLETEFMTNGRWDVSDVEEPAFREFKKKYGLK